MFAEHARGLLLTELSQVRFLTARRVLVPVQETTQRPLWRLKALPNATDHALPFWNLPGMAEFVGKVAKSGTSIRMRGLF